MKLAVIGSRNYNDYETLCLSIGELLKTKKIDTIVSGGATGADALAKLYAEAHGIDFVEFLPDWATYGRAAGPIRNKQIIEYCDEVLAFWNGESKGTKSAINLAKKADKKVHIVKIEV